MIPDSWFQAQIKENIKPSRHWPLCGELTGDRWIPITKGQYTENVSFDDVIMQYLVALRILAWLLKYHRRQQEKQPRGSRSNTMYQAIVLSFQRV